MMHPQLPSPPSGSGQPRGLNPFVSLSGLLLWVSASLFLLPAVQAAVTTTAWLSTGVAAPTNGIILAGEAINPATGLAYRHLWYQDEFKGLCRLSADVAEAGPSSVVESSCLVNPTTLIPIAPGPVVFDSRKFWDGSRWINWIYAADATSKSQGIVRLKFDPAGDNGHGSYVFDSYLGGTGSCGLGANRPLAIALGPDGSVYVGQKLTGNVIRITSPNIATVPCTNFSSMGTSSDGRITFGLSFIGNDLYGLDNLGMFRIANSVACKGSCKGANVFGNVTVTPSAIASDQVYPDTGTTIYVSDPSLVYRIKNPSSTSPVVTNPWSDPFLWNGVPSWPTSITPDPLHPGTVFVADDYYQGKIASALGRLYKVEETAIPQPPGAPSQPVAQAGNGTATISWSAGTSGSTPITQYTVHTYLASLNPPLEIGTGTVVTTVAPDPAPATTATIPGLYNGEPYYFTVVASNSVGDGLASPPSATITPTGNTVPDAPIDVTGTAGDAQISLAWAAPLNDGGSPILSYLAICSSGLDYAMFNTPDGSVLQAQFSGLLNNVTYDCWVQAMNDQGPGPDSTAISLTPKAASVINVAVSASGTATVVAGAAATHTYKVTNSSPGIVPMVKVNVVVPVANLTTASVTTTQGSCTPPAAGVAVCSLGSLLNGATATINLNLTGVTDTLASSATAITLDAAGNSLPDSALGDNSAPWITNLAMTSTDLSLSGTVTGGTTRNSTATYTWTLSNRGKQTAGKVAFTNTLPSTLKFLSVTPPSGVVCQGPRYSGTFVSGGGVTCSSTLIAAGKSVAIKIAATVPATAGTVTTSGTAGFYGTDTSAANNSASVSVRVK